MLTSRCAWCEKTPERDQLKLCSACKKTAYCSRDCQAKQWPKHRMVCKDSGFVKLLSSPIGYEAMQLLQATTESYVPMNIWRSANDYQRISAYRSATLAALQAAWERCKPKPVRIAFLGSGTGCTPVLVIKEAQAKGIQVVVSVIEQDELPKRIVTSVLASNNVTSTATSTICPQCKKIINKQACSNSCSHCHQHCYSCFFFFLRLRCVQASQRVCGYCCV